MSVERVVGIGAGAAGLDPVYERGGTGTASELPTTDMVLNIGPQHPATHGVLRLRLTLDGERILHCEPIVGYMHRGAEKLFEVRDYRQILVLANRHDWLSAFSNELGVVLAVERMMGLEVPVRAVWLRTLLAELNRILNHLMFLGSYPLELGAITPVFYAFRERETIQAVMEELSGGRMHYMFNRVGGLKEDIPLGWLQRAGAASAAVRRRLPDIENLILGNEIFRARTVGVGRLSPELIAAYGVSGPIARASGVDADLRRDEPYLAYEELAQDGVLRVVTRTEGDCYARFSLLLDQVKVSLDLVDACLDRLLAMPGRPGQHPPPQDPQGPRRPDLLLDREPPGHQRLLPRLPRRQNPLAPQTPLRQLQQHLGPPRNAPQHHRRRHDRHPRQHVLRSRRHRQVAAHPP
ncbi:NADH-quinone oxidoreductase subunit D [Kribbella qitaiheensis]|uniref:NADH-quinone oxidoreductase subunit D n=1 Tax=Kribbella qitaiheensis TaxID=1544730 RepID=UPI003D18F7CF